MTPSAQAQILDYLTVFEGNIDYMYVDNTNLVSTGIGILLDPFDSYGMIVPWYDKNTGKTVTDRDVVRAEFDDVKKKDYKFYLKYKDETNLRVPRADILKKTNEILVGKEKSCKQYFGAAAYDGFPADVQVVLTQMSFAGGLYYRQSQLAPLLAVRDWLGARAFTYLNNSKGDKAPYIKYNEVFKQLMLNAYIVEGCAKVASNKVSRTPTDIKTFYGYKMALSVERAFGSDDPGPILPDDNIVIRDRTAWVNGLK